MERDSLKSHKKMLLLCSFQTLKLLNLFSRKLLRLIWMEEAGFIQMAVSLWVRQPAFLMVCLPAVLVMCLKWFSSAFSLYLRKDFKSVVCVSLYVLGVEVNVAHNCVPINQNVWKMKYSRISLDTGFFSRCYVSFHLYYIHLFILVNVIFICPWEQYRHIS